MARELPSQPRSSISRTLEGLEVRIPASRSVFLGLFVGFWLVGWTVGGIAAMRQLARSERLVPDQLFLLAWLGMWAVGWVVAAGFWVWNLAGIETVTLRPAELVLRRQVFSIGRTREYDIAHVSRLRLSPGVVGRRGQGPSIAFDYGAKTIHFAGGVDEAEAFHIVTALQEAHPPFRTGAA